MKMLDYKQQLTREGILLSYCGPFTQEMVEELGGTIRRQIEMKFALIGHGGGSMAISKMFSIFIEMSQNIVRYSEETFQPVATQQDAQSMPLRLGIVVIGMQDGKNYVHCGNMIRANDSERIANTLKEIQGMTREELSATYRRKRREKPEEGSKGAGLGFLEMARHGSKIEFQTESLNADNAFFTIKVWV